MIVVNGEQFRTLKQEFYVNEKQVLEAYANGKLVYPEREDTYLIKITGSVDRTITHDHTNDDAAQFKNKSNPVVYLPGPHSYREKASFSLVFRCHNYFDNYYQIVRCHQLRPNSPVVANTSPMFTVEAQSNVFPYDFSTACMYPDKDGIHPLFGAESLDAFALVQGNAPYRSIGSVELLMHVDVGAPPLCGWTAEKFYINGGYPYRDAVITPLKDRLDNVPADVNGIYRLSAYRKDFRTGNGFVWLFKSPSGQNLCVKFCTNRIVNIDYSYLTNRVIFGTDGGCGYKAPYLVKGTRQGSYREFTHEFAQSFNFTTIPITKQVYAGLESQAPQHALHPKMEDLVTAGKGE